MELRLQKYLANCGICSRRKAEAYIVQGLVQVNGVVCDHLGTKVSESDEVLFRGEKVQVQKSIVYLMLHKPEGYVSTVQDQFGRLTVLDLVSDVPLRLFPVGRLDYETSGLLLLTNDGALTYTLTHPKHHVDKIYIATVQGAPQADAITAFEAGINIDDYRSAPAKLEIVKSTPATSTLRITIHEGRNRQVRKMCAAIGHPVLALKRIGIGAIRLGSLEKGAYRSLTTEEISYLKSCL